MATSTSSTGSYSSSSGEIMGDSDRHSTSNGHSRQDPKPKEGRIEEMKVEFSEDEEMLIARMFNLVGQRWSLIAGRIPGRTAEEIEKYWSSRHSSQ
ncbi:hypothetical protein V6N13_062482 [Hibiscus sabdariffa]|uniref:Uncharacterized protein n=2 Tax=Hibiscus sabdariffa TaxID=183260 RepID=A0ABR2N6N1_9ROSI